MAEALLVVDVQRGLVDALAPQRRPAFLATLDALIERARARGAELVYVRHGDEELRSETPPWEIADEIGPRPNDPIVEKHHGDAFEETNLAAVLAAAGVDHVVICGMQSDYCVDATARGAARRNFRVSVVEDGHATYADAVRTEQQICDDVNRQLRDAGVDVVASSHVFTHSIV